MRQSNKSSIFYYLVLKTRRRVFKIIYALLIAAVFLVVFWIHTAEFLHKNVILSISDSDENARANLFTLKDNRKCLPSKTKLNKKKFRSQRMEDALLDHHVFKGRTGGIFLEIGGLDGLKFSNSWYFEQSLCWRGILIEGLPSSFEKMKNNRPLAVNIGRAVCSQAGVVSYVIGNNSATAGLERHMDEDFKQMWHKSSNKVDVCCNPMNEILQPIMVPYLNLLSIDVEGAEEIILKTIDWANLPVEVIVVETDERFMQENKVNQITNFLQSKGLTIESNVKIKHSTVYRNFSFNLDSIDVHAWSEYAKTQVSSTFGANCKLAK
mmetsp:Transcript_3437/g.12239  ORF Transcript_3437/g.12239 Transcript_3437/m.12239 type:complete len:323 (+) Transcript_3437:3216-4184(+)